MTKDTTTARAYLITPTNMPSQILISGGEYPNDFSLQINKVEGSKIVKAVNEYEEILESLKWSLKTINNLVRTYGIEKTSNDPSKTNWDRLYTAQQALARAESN